jgi:hypothetical protein
LASERPSLRPEDAARQRLKLTNESAGFATVIAWSQRILADLEAGDRRIVAAIGDAGF